MNKFDAQARYCTWRLQIYLDYGELTTDEIDVLVGLGVLRPGMTIDEVHNAIEAQKGN